jgi:hypothetical protein
LTEHFTLTGGLAFLDYPKRASSEVVLNDRSCRSIYKTFRSSDHPAFPRTCAARSVHFNSSTVNKSAEGEYDDT